MPRPPRSFLAPGFPMGPRYGPLHSLKGSEVWGPWFVVFNIVAMGYKDSEEGAHFGDHKIYFGQLQQATGRQGHSKSPLILQAAPTTGAHASDPCKEARGPRCSLALPAKNPGPPNGSQVRLPVSWRPLLLGSKYMSITYFGA